MKKLLISTLLAFVATSSFAQSRDLGAYRLILDNGGSPLYRLTLQADPGMVGDATFTFPSGGGSFPGNGTVDGQTLRWNNSSTLWEPSSLLTNTGTRLGFGTISPAFEMHFRDTLISPTATINSETYTDGTGAVGFSGFYGANFSTYANGTTTFGTASTIGLAGRITSLRAAGNTVPRAIGIVGSVDNLGLGVVTEGAGVAGQIANSTAGALMTTATGFDALTFNSGTITNMMGFRFRTPFGGTITNLDAVLVENIATSSANGYALRYAHATDPASINAAGKLTLGATPTTMGDRLEIRSSSTATTQVIGSYGQLAMAPSGTTTQNSFGLAYDATAADGGDMTGRSLIGIAGGSLSTRTTGGIGRMIGSFGYAYNGSTASTADVTGVYGEAIASGASTVTAANGVMGRVFAGAGTITDAAALYASQGSAFGGGSVTNNYGLLIDPMTMGTTSNTAILYDHTVSPFTVTGVGRVGIATAGPQTFLDVSGDMSIRTAGTYFLAGGAQSIDATGLSYAEVSADAGGSSISAIQGGVNGKVLILYSTGSGNLSLLNEDGLSTTTDRIRTMTGADIATAGEAAITLIYNASASRWIVLNVQD
jgi:hypothetical protein